jgi:hypothetical protein
LTLVDGGADGDALEELLLWELLLLELLEDLLVDELLLELHEALSLLELLLVEDPLHVASTRLVFGFFMALSSELLESLPFSLLDDELLELKESSSSSLSLSLSEGLSPAPTSSSSRCA